MRYHNHGAGTLAGEIVAFLRGGPLTPAARDTLLACDNCGRCADWCPVHVAPTIFRAGRQALASHDGG
jgi:ferredoxin